MCCCGKMVLSRSLGLGGGKGERVPSFVSSSLSRCMRCTVRVVSDRMHILSNQNRSFFCSVKMGHKQSFVPWLLTRVKPSSSFFFDHSLLSLSSFFPSF